MKIYLGTDHNGYRYRQQVIDYLKLEGHSVVDESNSELSPDDDFPVFAGKVCSALIGDEDRDTRGILICGSGQGMVMAANRFKGIRAGLGYSSEAAIAVRNDEDSNVLSLPSSVLGGNEWQHIVSVWLKTPFAGASRYIRRNQELDEL